jgi:hypothetical protein
VLKVLLDLLVQQARRQLFQDQLDLQERRVQLAQRVLADHKVLKVQLVQLELLERPVLRV